MTIAQRVTFDLVMLVTISLFWLPTILAVWRKYPRIPLVATLNLFFLWPVALIYVVSEPSHRVKRPRKIAEPEKVAEFRPRTGRL